MQNFGGLGRPDARFQLLDSIYIKFPHVSGGVVDMRFYCDDAAGLAEAVTGLPWHSDIFAVDWPSHRYSCFDFLGEVIRKDR